MRLELSLSWICSKVRRHRFTLLIALYLLATTTLARGLELPSILPLGVLGLGLLFIKEWGRRTLQQVGVALLGGSIVALAVTALEWNLSTELARLARDQQAASDQAALMNAREAAQQGLRLTLTVEDDLRGVDLSQRNLRSFLLRDKNLSEAVMTGADLRGADLRGSVLAGADLSQAKLDGASMEQVIWDSRTIWPSGWAVRLQDRSLSLEGDLAGRRLPQQLEQWRREISRLVAENSVFAIDVQTGGGGFAPIRPSYRYAGPDTLNIEHITFNSLRNNPNFGDERTFLVLKPADMRAKGGFRNLLTIGPGDRVLLKVYGHNNANTNNFSSDQIAVNTRVRVAFPTTAGTHLRFVAYISADNAKPAMVSDAADLESPVPFRVAFVPGSARIYTNFVPRGIRLDDAVADPFPPDSPGVLVGLQKLNGRIPGGFYHTFIVTLEADIVAA